MGSRRAPNITLLCRRVTADLARALPELAHVRAAQILFVAGEARRASRATVKALGSQGAPAVVLGGTRMRYSITLRPKFFRDSTLEQRVGTLIHELLHVSTRFDGTLQKDRKHALMPRPRYARLVEPLVQRYLAEGDPSLVALLGHDGPARARQWLERPTGREARESYGEAQLFVGPVEMITRRKVMH